MLATRWRRIRVFEWKASLSLSIVTIEVIEGERHGRGLRGSTLVGLYLLRDRTGDSGSAGLDGAGVGGGRREQRSVTAPGRWR
jgi:hypothetical protein